MGADNRDWYRDWWRKKTGYRERADFRRPARQVQREKDLRFSNWHPILKLLTGIVVVGAVAAVVRILKLLLA
jgi:hypothetical protein